MSPIQKAISFLLPWRADRSAGDQRHLIASWAARSLVLYFIVERLAVISWATMAGAHPRYSYSFNFISDLGVRACHDQDKGANYERWVCSPLFPLVDFTFIFTGVGAVAVAALVTTTVLKLGGKGASDRSLSVSKWPERLIRFLQWLQHMAAHGARIAMAVAGLALIGIGAWPEDYDWVSDSQESPTQMHTLSTAVFLFAAVITLLLLGSVWLKDQTVTAIWILMSGIVAGTGGLLLLMFNHDNPNKDAALGTLERMVVYGFIAGLFFMGYTLGKETKRHHVEDSASGAASGNGRHVLNGKKKVESPDASLAST